jgi:hypothetical protein
MPEQIPQIELFNCVRCGEVLIDAEVGSHKCPGFTRESHQLFIFTEVAQERERQDRQWGGPEHDDEHSVLDWAQFIAKQFCLVREDANARQRFVKIAALAIAAVESIDRGEERVEALRPPGPPKTPKLPDIERG